MRTIVFDGIQAISSSLNELEEDEGTASDRELDLLELRSEISMAQRKLREESARLEVLLIKHIDRNGDIQIGDGQRLYVGRYSLWCLTRRGATWACSKRGQRACLCRNHGK